MRAWSRQALVPAVHAGIIGHAPASVPGQMAETPWTMSQADRQRDGAPQGVHGRLGTG
jgi:hypothetical protein